MIADAMRRIRNAMAFGVTTSPVTAPNGVAQVQVSLNDLEVLTLKLVEKRGVAANMPVGTPVVAMFQAGDRGNGVVMGSVAPGSRPAMAGDQDAALFGHGFVITIAADGVHITGAPDVFVTGNLHVNGEVTAQAQGNSVTLSQHKHPAINAAPTPHT